MSHPSPSGPGVVVASVSAVTAVVSLAGSLLLGVVLVPAVAPILEALSAPVSFGFLLLGSAFVRVAAGVVGARQLRRRRGLDRRTEALPSVAVGAVAGWLAYELIALVAVLAVGGSLPLGLVALELLRWVAEACLGGYLVSAGPAQTLDPRLRRFAITTERPR